MKNAKVLLVGLLLNFTGALAAKAEAGVTSCQPHIFGAFSLETDVAGRITSGEIGLIYKNYRKCDPAQENTRIVKEFGEYVMKGECVGTAKLLYDRVEKLLYAIEPEGNRKIAISKCSEFAHDVNGERLIFEMAAAEVEHSGFELPYPDLPALEQRVVDKLFLQAGQRCASAGFSGRVRTMSALVKSVQFTGHFGNRAVGRAESIFSCE